MLLVLGRMRVLDQDDGVTKRQRSTNGSIYTELRVHPANHKVRNGTLLEEIL